MTPAKMTERILPPKFKHIIDNEFILRLTFRERLKVMLGYRIDVRYAASIEHLPGKILPTMTHKVVNKF